MAGHIKRAGVGQHFQGPRAVFFAGRPLSVQSRMRLTQVGFVLILMLMVWAIGNDILRLVGI